MKFVLVAIFHLLALMAFPQSNLVMNWARSLSNTPIGGGVGMASIALGANGDFYVAGNFSLSIDVDPGLGVSNLTSNGSVDIFFARYTALGQLVYARSIGGTGGDYVTAIAVDGEDNVYITGYFSGNADFDPGTGIANLSSIGDNDIYLAKYDASGNYIYAFNLGSGSDDRGLSVAVDASGAAYITGYFRGVVDFNPNSGWNPLASNDASADIFLAKYDASGNYLFAIGMGGISFDAGTAVKLDGDGNAYLTGSFNQTVDFDYGINEANLVSSGASDIFIAKYDAAGNYIFAKNMGGLSNEAGNSLALSASGEIFITGYFTETADFDPGPGSALLTSNGNWDIFVARYDASGGFINAFGVGSLSSDQALNIGLDASGHVFITGEFRGMLDFDPGPDENNLISAGQTDIFLAKFTLTGNLVFAIKMGSTNSDKGAGLGVDASGGVYLAGDFYNTVDFDPGPGVFNLSVPVNNVMNGFIARYGSSGSLLWAGPIGQYSNTVANSEARAVKLDADGNVYVAGFFRGVVDFDPGAGVAYLSSAGNTDGFLAKYDAQGNYIFAFRIGATSEDRVNAIEIDAGGNVLLIGQFQGQIDVDPGPDEFLLTSNGDNDIFLAKYSSSGNLIFAKNMGGASGDVVNDIALNDNGEIYLTGYFMGTSDFNPGPGTANLVSSGNTDIFLAKYDANGNYVYALSIGSSSADIGFSIEVDAAGAAYISGYYSGTVDFDPGPGSTLLSSLFNNDAFFAKFDTDGNFVYAKSIAGPGSEIAYSIAVSDNGMVYLTGYFDNQIDLDPGPGASNYTSVNSFDIFFAKYDASGDYIFGNTIGSSLDDRGHQIAVDNDGNIYLTGNLGLTADFDPGPGTANLTSLGQGDIFVAKYDDAGNYKYARRMGGTLNDRGYSIDVGSEGKVVIAGFFSGSATFNPESSDVTLRSLNGTDIYLAHYSESGSISTGTLSHSICLGASINVPFTVSYPLNSGNVFSAQLSNASGSFAAPINIGSLAATGSGSISATIPEATVAGTGYRIRVVSSSPAVTGTDNGADISIQLCCANPTNGGTIASNQTICHGETPAMLTSSTPASGHTGTLEYKWQYTTSDPDDPGFDPTSWTDINASNATTYQPDAITQTTWYRRLARVDCVLGWGNAVASNVVSVTVSTARIHVTVSGAGLMDGSSWANAMSGSQLQAAINASCVTEVWVAAGTYQPALNTSFSMKEGVAILGGFPNTGNPGLAERNYAANATILQGNGTRVINNTNNGLTNAAILDGFTITGGTASGSSGPGTLNINVSPTFRNCIFTGNSGYWDGSLYFQHGTAIVDNCIFIGNTASVFSGGLRLSWNGSATSPKITNCSFSGNTGPGIHINPGASPFIHNCVIWGNGSGIFAGINSSPTVTHSIVQGGFTGTGNLDIDPLFINQPVIGLGSSGDLRLQTCSPAINAGDNAAVPAGITRDLDNNPRFYNSGTVDMGAYELQAVPASYPTNGGTIASSQSLCSGSTPAQLTSSAPASGQTGTLEYKWQYTTSDPDDAGFDPASWSDIASSNAATFQPGALSQTTWYRRLARVDCGLDWSSAAASNTILITVDPAPFASVVTYPSGFVLGFNPSAWSTNFSVDGAVFFNGTNTLELMAFASYDASAGATVTIPLTGTISFSWQYDASMSPPVNEAFGFVLNGIPVQLTDFWNNNQNGVVSALPVNEGDEFGFWLSSQTNGVGSTMAVINGFSFQPTSYSVTVCNTGSYTLESSVASASNGTILWTHNGSGQLEFATTLQPKYTPSLADGGNVVTLTLSVTSQNACSPATAAAQYGLLIQNCCANPTSGGTIASNQTLCSGSTPALLTSSAPASGHTGTLEYKWQYTTSDPSGAGFDPLSWADIASSNSATYQPDALTQINWFRRLARVDCESDWSSAVASNVVRVAIVPEHIFITENGAGLMDGSSWANAMPGTAIQEALDNSVCNNVIWVAKGRYVPTTEIGGGGTRFRSFSMKPGVQLLGGFSGNEDPLSFDISTRDFETNETILDGDINGDDEVTGEDTNFTLNNYGDNTHRVVLFRDDLVFTNSTIIDGFTIRGGNSNIPLVGGAIHIDRASPLLRNLVIKESTAHSDDGAVRVLGGSPVFENCLFTRNLHNMVIQSRNWGVPSALISNVTINNSTFRQNKSNSGGAIYLRNFAKLQMDNCLLEQNEATGHEGGAIFINNSEAQITNTIIRNNTAYTAGGGISFMYPNMIDYGIRKRLVLQNVDLIDNITGSAMGGGLSASNVAELSFVKGVIEGNIANNDRSSYYSGGGGIFINAEPNAIINLDGLKINNHTIPFGYGGGLYIAPFSSSAGYDLSLKNSKITNNYAPNSGGIALAGTVGVRDLENLLISGNQAISIGGIWSAKSNTVFKNVTITRNISQQSAVIFAFSPQLINSIVWDNTVIQWPHWHSFEPSLVINSTIHNEPGMYPTPLALSGIDMSDPLFVNPDMGDFRLMQGSPLIDQGNNSYSTVDFDVRGAGFPRRIDRSNAGALGTVDRGAFEFNIDTDCILPTDGGTIGASQVICSGSVPVLLNSLSVVGPAYGPVTYKWQSTTSNPSSPGFDPESWTDIASSNSITYQPDALTQTTWFRRLAKVDCAPGWSGAAASNIVQITAQTLTLNMAGQMPAGLGTSSNPYLIANFDNLLWLTANPSAWDKHFLQTADIDALVTSNACFNNGAGWSPIGILGQPFQGTYDGDYHTISNVFIHLPAQSRVGFFGATGFDAHINRLSLINAQVTGGNRTGLMLGELRGTVFQSGATGMVSGGDFTGGFAGIIESGLPVSQSFANANVSATGTAGGFAGYAHATISDCYAVGTLNINGNQSGGFLGAIYGGEAVRSYSAMNANVISSGWTGGFVAALIGPQSVLADNFFDNDIHSPTVSFGATPKTTLDMTMQSTFTNAGWDFSLPIWGMNPDINNSYPHLSWQDRWAGELIDLPIGTIVYDDTWQWNGTPLEWIFVEKQVPVMYETVLMARQHIHVMPYRTDLLDNNYEQSSVRHYLNTDFYGSFSHAFKSIGEQRSFNWASSFSNTIGQQGYVVDVVFLPAVSELGGPILSPILTRTFSYFSGPEGHIRRASAPGFQNMTRSGIFQLNPPANQRIYYIDILGAFYNDIMSTVTAPFAVRPAMFVQPYTHFVRQPDGRYKLRTHRVLYTATDGTINGTADQQVAHGRSGEQVTAVPNAGYKFVSWSDGNTNPQRTENNVTATLSLQASFEPCQNPDNGGLIGNNQFLCLGTEPQLLSSIADPSGYMGTIEYQWQYTYSDPEAPGFDPASWVNIPSTNTNTYQPVAVEQTTWYRRIAGLTCDPEKFASNVVKIEVSLYEISATADAIEFSYACGANETLTVSENAGSIVFDVPGRYFSLNGGAPQLFPATLLLSEVNQITINAGLGNDVINVGNFASQLPNLTINGGQGNDVVNFGGDITFKPNANLDVDLQNDHASPGEDIVTIAANANLIFQGSGSAVIKLSKWMTIDTGGSIEVVDGNLIIEVNQQTPTTIGNFHGLIVPGLLRTTGQGDIIVKSTAGKDATGFMVAFWMHTNGRIESTANEAGKGNIFITATVKDGYTGGASGIQIRNNSSIFSAGGDIRIDGQVGSGYASSVGSVGSNGMSIYENGAITATGPAAIQINLSSGDALLGSSYAFDMRATGAKITSVDGDITINAESGSGNANPNFVLSNGAFITSGAFIETTGTGNITLTAQSGQVVTAGSGSQSLRLDAPSYVRSSNGNIHISATNVNNFSGTTFNHGSSIRGNVSSTGTGNITIEGTAGITNAVFANGSQGVQVRNGATVSSAGGNITIRGTADNTAGNEALTIARVGNGTVSIGDPTKSITFEGNSMDIHPSNGTVNAGSGTVVLKGRTAGHELDLGGADATGILGLSDAELDRVTAGTLVLGGSTSGDITVSSSISRSAATNMQLISNEDILFTGGGINTSGGTLLLNPGDSPAAVYPDYDGTDATVSTISFGSDLGIIINGNTPGDGTGSTYTQLTVQGNIDLTGVDLVLSGTHTPAVNETFVIVNNTGDQPIISTFNSIPEGGLISDVLGSGLTGLISYTGGDGNDVVLTLCSNPTNGGIIADNQTICYNTIPSIFTSTGLPTGHAGTLEYKWQHTTSDPDDPGFDSTSWTDINSSNATTYQPGALTQTTWYRRLARVDCSSDWSGAAASNTIKVTVRPQFTPGAIATTGETICYGGSPGQIGNVTTASGGDQTITYSWRSSEDNYTAAISGATSSTYTPPAGLTTTTTYRRYAKDGTCNTTPEQSTGEWTVMVEPTPVAGVFISNPAAFTTVC
ncbi:MAG: DUF6273 domain-containing protein, partial [Bacteroidia bacterium]|nr:DUF6273 domain-containing protein [Bacteroidia bacterium]